MSEVRLLPHQAACLDQLEGFTRCAIYHDMGLGKTFSGAEKAVHLDPPTILVICQKSKVQDWLDHFTEFYTNSDLDYCSKDLIFDMTKPKGLQAFMSAAKSTQGCEDSFPFFVVGVINYDLIFRRPILKQLQHFTMVLDESSVICNENTKRSKTVLNMNPDAVILLSGTPTGGKYEKLWSQCQLLGWNISKDTYMKSYVQFDWVDIGICMKPVVKGYKNVEHLKKKLREHGAVFLKTEEVIDLPPKIEQHIYLNPTREYKKFMANDYLMLNQDVELVGDNTLTKILYARQLCGQYHKEKLGAFRDILQSTDDRLIVFYNYTAELKEMLTICEDEEKPTSILNGSTKDLTAYNDRDDSVTFIQYQAGAMGGNFQKANKMIFFTLPLGKGSCLLWEQAKKRIHRIGQEKPCFYYYLLVRNSIEIRNYESLKIGKDYTDELFRKDDENETV